MRPLCLVALGLATHVAGRPHQLAFGPAARPTLDDEHGEADPSTATRMSALLDKYAPVVKLSAVEAYFPSSIEYMLDHYPFIEYENGTTYDTNSSFLTPSELHHLPDNGFRQFLSIQEEHNPQPFMDDDAAYLFGPYGQEDDVRRHAAARPVITEDIYGFWVDQGRGVVDLWYWTFYPFNYGKLVGSFGILGNHVADWEHLRVRTIHGKAVSADYDTHSGLQFSAGTIRWEDVEKVDGRPVGYAAAGSHGMWPRPGNHVYAHILDIFRLVDVTDDDGPVWDTKGHVVSAQYWDGPDRRRRIWHRGDGGWLNYRGRWGNRGENDCWWYKLVGICQLVDAPGGPNRQLAGPPDCTIAPLSWEQSTYRFYLAPSIARYADERGVAFVQVEQICGRPRKNDDDDEDGSGLDLPDLPDGGDPGRPDGRDVDTYITKGSARFVGLEQHAATTPSCAGTSSAVRGYRIALCLANGQCIKTFKQRSVCSYETGKPGYKYGGAVTVDDPDDWFAPF